MRVCTSIEEAICIYSPILMALKTGQNSITFTITCKLEYSKMSFVISRVWKTKDVLVSIECSFRQGTSMWQAFILARLFSRQPQRDAVAQPLCSHLDPVSHTVWSEKLHWDSSQQMRNPVKDQWLWKQFSVLLHSLSYLDGIKNRTELNYFYNYLCATVNWNIRIFE